VAEPGCTLTVRRPIRCQAALRAFQLHLDDEFIGELRLFKPLTVRVEPGYHQLWAGVGRFDSFDVPFHAGPGDRLVGRVRPTYFWPQLSELDPAQPWLNISIHNRDTGETNSEKRTRLPIDRLIAVQLFIGLMIAAGLAYEVQRRSRAGVKMFLLLGLLCVCSMAIRGWVLHRGELARHVRQNLAGHSSYHGDHPDADERRQETQP